MYRIMHRNQWFARQIKPAQRTEKVNLELNKQKVNIFKYVIHWDITGLKIVNKNYNLWEFKYIFKFFLIYSKSVLKLTSLAHSLN